MTNDPDDRLVANALAPREARERESDPGVHLRCLRGRPGA